MKFNHLGFAVRQCPYTEAWQVISNQGYVESSFDTEREAKKATR